MGISKALDIFWSSSSILGSVFQIKQETILSGNKILHGIQNKINLSSSLKPQQNLLLLNNNHSSLPDRIFNRKSRLNPKKTHPAYTTNLFESNNIRMLQRSMVHNFPLHMLVNLQHKTSLYLRRQKSESKNITLFRPNQFYNPNQEWTPDDK